MTEDLTLFQQLVSDVAVSGMINDLEDPETLIPEGETLESMDGWEIALHMNPEDIPRILEELRELEEMNNEQQ
jgi:hypothetical protein